MHSDDDLQKITLLGGPYPYPPDGEKVTTRVNLFTSVIQTLGWADDIETDMALQVVRATMKGDFELEKMEVVSSGDSPLDALRSRMKDLRGEST